MVAAERCTWKGAQQPSQERRCETFHIVHVKKSHKTKTEKIPVLNDYEKYNHKPQTPPFPKSCQSPPGNLPKSLYAVAQRNIHLRKHHLARRIEENHHFSFDMNINAVHVRDIRIFDQTFWWLQSFAVEF
jgi:hypothetical protein